LNYIKFVGQFVGLRITESRFYRATPC